LFSEVTITPSGLASTGHRNFEQWNIGAGGKMAGAGPHPGQRYPLPQHRHLFQALNVPFGMMMRETHDSDFHSCASAKGVNVTAITVLTDSSGRLHDLHCGHPSSALTRTGRPSVNAA
jgi:hypothetical protein